MRLRISLAFLFVLCFSAPVLAEEVITDYHVDIAVRADGVLDVTENITVIAEGKKIRRGIFRDFPTDYKDRYGNTVTTGIDVIDVRKDGGPVNWVTEKRSNGTRIRIGSKNVLLNKGTFVYQIKYSTPHQIIHRADEDELFWNATGSAWDFAIGRASVMVRLPPGATVRDTIAFTGPRGATGSDWRIAERGPDFVLFETTTSLPRQNGLTVGITWPDGSVTRPTESEQVFRFVDDNPIITLGLLGLVLIAGYFWLVWDRIGRDPEKGPVFARYEPPNGLSPAACRFISKMGYDDEAFTAAIVSLAVKGAILIDDSGSKMKLEKVGEGRRLSPGEKRVLRSLLYAVGDTIRLENEKHATFSAAKKLLQKAIAAEYEGAHFKRNRVPLWIGIALSAALLLLLSIFTNFPPGAVFISVWCCVVMGGGYGAIAKAGKLLGALKGAPGAASAVHGVGAIFGLGVIGTMLTMGGSMLFEVANPSFVVFSFLLFILCALFSQLMKAPTGAGRKLMDEIDGFKLYLSVAEKDRMNFHNPPDRTPEHFEEYLPYAIALGVENEWGEQFDNILSAASVDLEGSQSGYRWYRGSSYRSFSGRSFASSLNSSLGSAISSASTAPSSSSSGGFSGGGSSGGGGGGGGGGGW